MALRLDVITLFPDAFSSVLASSIVGRAVRDGRVEIVLARLTINPSAAAQAWFCCASRSSGRSST